MLFDDEPPPEEHEDLGWVLDKGMEPVDPHFLRACGIEVPFDGGEDFYYGEDCQTAQHPPIRIELSLPEALAEMWGLE